MNHPIRTRIGCLLLTCLMLCTAILPVTAAEASSGTVCTVTYTSPAIPADVGETVDLTKYRVATSASAYMEASDITWSSDALIVENGKVIAPAKGVYALTAKTASNTRTVYLVVKEPSETEYVLYETDFSDPAVLNNWTKVQQTAGASYSVTDGKLTMNASDATSSYVRLMLPAFLNDFGDYHYEATGTITEAKNEKRYLALMFRIQKNNFPYYQMCVRQNATLSNGTEFAERTEKDAWNVTHTAAYSEKLSASKDYTFAVDVTGNAIATSINGERLVYTETATKYTKGAPGLQVNGCSASFTSVKVTLMTETVEPSASKLVQVREPASNLNQTPSIVTYIGTADDLNNILTNSPATAIMYVNSAMEVTDGKGTKLATVAEAMKMLNKQVIPAFRVSDEATVKALCAYLEENKILDVFVLSDNESLIRLARDTYESVRGILDLSNGVGSKTVSDIRNTANMAGARIAVIPADLATQSYVESLQRLFTTVWVQSTAQADTVELVSHITSGANGIITQNRTELERCFTAYFRENSLVRVVNIIGHRGQPSTGQENSIASSVDAYEAGANMIENDVYVSKDGIIVIMHDSTIDRTTTGSGNIERMTVAELQQYVIDANTSFATQPIPTLQDYFSEFKGKDVQIIIELKSDNPKVIEPLANEIRASGMMDQINIITFEYQQLAALRKLLPEVSVGYLTSGITLSETEPLTSLEKILSEVQHYDTTFNPSYAKGALGPNLITAASHRGITLWPWTVNDRADFDTYFLYGVNGITTNYSYYVSDYIKTVTTEQTSYNVNLGEETDLPVLRTNYDREQISSTAASMVVLTGNEAELTYKNGVLTANEAGEYTVIFRHASLTNSGKMYYKYTQPVTISVTDPQAVPEETTPVETAPVDNPSTAVPVHNTTTSIPTTGIIVIIVAAVALLTVGVVLFAIKRR